MSVPDPLSILEALLFAAAEPLSEGAIQEALGERGEARLLLRELQRQYADRGVRLECSGRRWAFRTAPELAPFLQRADRRPRRLSAAALETLAIIAYRQPVTRGEIEAVRGVAVSRGTLDLLVETGLVAPRGRKEVPGRPVMWVTTPRFLDHFGLSSLEDLPRLEELEGASLFKQTSDR